MRIKIYDRIWTVIPADPSAGELADVDGWCDPSRREIHFDCSIDPIRKRDVLLHEIIHAHYHEHRWPAKMKEERVATWLGKALSVFLHENRAFAQKHLL